MLTYLVITEKHVRNDLEPRSYGHRFSGSSNYLGMGIDMTLPEARSVNQRVSPAGSTLVGVFQRRTLLVQGSYENDAGGEASSV